MSVAVVGGGLTGLAAGFRLAALGHQVTVYEAESRPGGVAGTERREGYLAETGPNSFTEPEPAVQTLLADLGLAARQIEAGKGAVTRYVVREGRLVTLPSSPADLLSSPALSLSAKLAILREPFVPARATSAADESIADFVRRRLGDEVLDYAAGPFVGGIYAGDPAALSVRYALPRLHALEREHGSILRGAMARARAVRRGEGGVTGGRAGRLFSFPSGLGELPETLASRLGGRLRTSAPVLALSRIGSSWRLRVAGGEAQHEAVIYAGPAHALGVLHFAGEEGAHLAQVAAMPYVPVAVVVLGFRRGDVAHPLDGFGVLVPAVEGRRLLGVLFSSSLFPGRAPAGHVALTAFVGGARQPELTSLPPDALAELVREELAALLGASRAPTFRHVTTWPRAIPQYVLGFETWLAAMDRVEAANPGLVLAGTYRHGVAVGQALASGLGAAERVAALLASRGPP